MRVRDFAAAATVWSCADKVYDLVSDRPRHSALEEIIVCVFTVATIYLAAALIDRAHLNKTEL